MLLRIAKGIVIVAIVLVAVLIGGGWLLSPRFEVTRSVLVDAPPGMIYPLIASPRAWPQWSVWNQRDPAMRIDYGGAESGAGKWAWRSESEGDGEMSFTAAEPDRRIAYTLALVDFGATSLGEFTLLPEGNATRITWSIAGDMGGNPLLRWMALAADKVVGRDFDAGLARLKALAEKPS
jgi:uncharacterized protein YndB with AHSA1/START domain